MLIWYLFSIVFWHITGISFIKPVPALIAAYYSTFKWISVGLIFAGLGDLLLEWDYFSWGVISFTLCQICFCLFCNNISVQIPTMKEMAYFRFLYLISLCEIGLYPILHWNSLLVMVYSWSLITSLMISYYLNDHPEYFVAAVIFILSDICVLLEMLLKTHFLPYIGLPLYWWSIYIYSTATRK